MHYAANVVRAYLCEYLLWITKYLSAFHYVNSWPVITNMFVGGPPNVYYRDHTCIMLLPLKSSCGFERSVVTELIVKHAMGGVYRGGGLGRAKPSPHEPVESSFGLRRSTLILFGRKRIKWTKSIPHKSMRWIDLTISEAENVIGEIKPHGKKRTVCFYGL